MTTFEARIEKLNEIHNWELFKLLFAQLSLEMGENRFLLTPVVLRFMDSIEGVFQYDSSEVNVFGTPGFNGQRDIHSSFVMEKACYERGGSSSFTWLRGTHYGIDIGY